MRWRDRVSGGRGPSGPPTSAVRPPQYVPPPCVCFWLWYFRHVHLLKTHGRRPEGVGKPLRLAVSVSVNGKPWNDAGGSVWSRTRDLMAHPPQGVGARGVVTGSCGREARQEWASAVEFLYGGVLVVSVPFVLTVNLVGNEPWEVPLPLGFGDRQGVADTQGGGTTPLQCPENVPYKYRPTVHACLGVACRTC